MQLVCHLTMSPLWHIHQFAYNRFNCRDGIRYNYISICGVDLIGGFLGGYWCVEKYFRWKFKVELKLIGTEFQFFNTKKIWYPHFIEHFSWKWVPNLVGTDCRVQVFILVFDCIVGLWAVRWRVGSLDARVWLLWPLLLRWFNFNPSMDK